MKVAARSHMHAALAVCSIVLSAAGQLGMKAGMHALATSHASPSPGSLLASGAVAWTIAGLFCYALSMLAWLVVLMRYRLSFIYPVLGLSFVLVYLGATYWPYLMEPPSARRGIGTAIIAIGVAIVSTTRRDRQP